MGDEEKVEDWETSVNLGIYDLPDIPQQNRTRVANLLNTITDVYPQFKAGPTLSETDPDLKKRCCDAMKKVHPDRHVTSSLRVHVAKLIFDKLNEAYKKCKVTGWTDN